MKKPCTHCRYRTFRGGDEEDRTLDLTDANRTLSQLSYAPMFHISSSDRNKYKSYHVETIIADFIGSVKRECYNNFNSIFFKVQTNIERSLRMDIRLHHIDKGSGEPLVLLHGNGESSEYFSRQIAFFSKHYRVLAVDTRGHGGSPRGTGPFTLTRFADDLKSFLTRLNIDRVNILGFSDGGNVALIFTLKNPECVSRLILNGANLNPLGLKPSELFPICLGWCAATLHALLDKSAVRKKELLTLMTAEPHVRAATLHSVHVPTLVIAGSRDMIRNRHTKKIHRNLPNGRLVILGGSHFIASENSAAFNDTVYRFLRENNEL